MNILELKHITYAYDRTPVLNDVSMTFEDGACYAIVGPSGAGKTTLLSLMSGLTAIQDGDILYQGKSLRQMNMYDYRSHDAGIIFQHYNLLTKLTALENVELAAQICRDPLPAATVLEEVGLKERMANFPAQLSGGEQQRVAIARALAKNPKLLLCDEPTGALDYNTGKAVLKLLQDTCRQSGVTVIVITHNQAITAMADRIITVKNGTIVSEVLNDHIVPVEQIEW